MNERIVHLAELYIYNKIRNENFQAIDDWLNWQCEEREYDINVYSTNFGLRAMLYPVVEGKTNTHAGVRIY